MLRSLQNKSVVMHDSAAYALFVVAVHFLILACLCGKFFPAAPVVITMPVKRAQTVVRWRSAAIARSTAMVSKAPVVEKPQYKVKKAPQPSPKRKAFVGGFTKINLGPKKKKKKAIITPPVVEEKKLPPQVQKIPEPVQEVPVQQPAVAQEPIEIDLSTMDQQELGAVIDAVHRWWQPPLGAAVAARCVIAVRLTDTGAIQELRVQQSSGVPVYDIAAKNALLKSIFPKQVWGKACIFQF